MNYSQLFETLENKIGFKPSQKNICEILGINPSAMANRKTRETEFSEEEIEKISIHYGVKLETKQSEFEINYYPNIFASCGAGCVPFDESKEKIRIAKESIANYSKSKEYFVISAKGSSMTPLIDDNDKCIVERYDNEQIIDDRVYLFRFNNEIFIKRLVKNIKQVIIKSENKEYQNIILENDELKDFEIIGQIVGLIREMR